VEDLPTARIALAWLLAKSVVTSVIIGAKRLDQLHDNLAAIELTLTLDELKLLDEVSALSSEYPGWVLPFQGDDRLGPADCWERLREARQPALTSEVVIEIGPTTLELLNAFERLFDLL